MATITMATDNDESLMQRWQLRGSWRIHKYLDDRCRTPSNDHNFKVTAVLPSFMYMRLSLPVYKLSPLLPGCTSWLLFLAAACMQLMVHLHCVSSSCRDPRGHDRMVSPHTHNGGDREGAKMTIQREAIGDHMTRTPCNKEKRASVSY